MTLPTIPATCPDCGAKVEREEIDARDEHPRSAVARFQCADCEFGGYYVPEDEE